MIGNRLTESTGAEAKTYSYDGHGNIVSDGTKTFVYNQNNRLVQVKQGETVLGEYFYDAFGRRVKKVVSGIVTVYHYDIAGNLIAETTWGGTPSRDIVYLNDERVAMKLYGYQAGWYYFINDHLGTPQKIVNESGEVVWAGFYQPFGKAWAYPADIINNFRFPGQYYDAETGLYYNWHRYYDPDTGRYITADPIGLEGGINLYVYVTDNPVNDTDLSGFNRRGRRGGGQGGEAGTRNPYADMEAHALVREIRQREPSFGLIRNNYDEYREEDVEFLREYLREIKERERTECLTNDRIRAGHAKERHPEWNNRSVDALAEMMRDIRENSIPIRAGNGNVLYRKGNIIMIENKSAKNRGTIFIRNESPRSIGAYIERFLEDNR